MFDNRYGSQPQRYSYGMQPNPNIVYGLNRVPDEGYARSVFIPEGVSVAMFNEMQDIVYIAANGGRYFRSFRLTPMEDTGNIAMNRAEIQQMIREELVRNGYISGYGAVPNAAAPEYRSNTDRGNTTGYDAGIRELHAGDAGARPGSGVECNAEQRQSPSGGASAGTADGAAV